MPLPTQTKDTSKLKALVEEFFNDGTDPVVKTVSFRLTQDPISNGISATGFKAVLHVELEVQKRAEKVELVP